MSFGSLRIRLLLAATISILVALGLVAAALTWLFQRHVERWIDAGLEIQLNQVVAGLARSPSGGIVVAKAPSDPRFERPLSGLYWQVTIDPGGTVLRSRSLWDFQLDLPQVPVDDQVRHGRLPGPARSRLYVLEHHIELPESLGGATSRIAVALDARDLQAAVRDFAGTLVWFLSIVGALLVAAAWIQVSVGLRPLAAMRNKLAAIRSGKTQRLGLDFPDEVQPLAREIDSLLDARQAQVEKARSRAADLAHGLKTPLQFLAGEAERLKASGATDAANGIESLAASMQRHIDRHLTRARLAPPSEQASANVRGVVARVAGVVERTPFGARLTWSNTVPADLYARIDSDDLAEALGNLIENGAQHARSRLTISGKRDRHRALVTVADDGPGIPEGRREEALMRGERLDASGPGTGLGLAIVADIAEACRGALSFDEPAKGFSVTLSLPLAGIR